MMKYKITYFLLPILIVGMLGSCRQKNQTEEQDMVNADTISTEIYVDTLVLRPQTFHRQLVCNGKLRAIAKCELSFSEGGIVSGIYVRNGGRVSKGQLIARTDNSEALLNVEKAQKDLERSKVDLADKLIGLGYDGISAKVPEGVMHRAKVSSGYFAAQYQLQSARHALTKCTLVAPFGGRIADLENKRNQRLDKLCTLINDSQLDVEFNVLEAEIKNIHVGQVVLVSPFVDEGKQYKGTVVNVNPMVSDKGLIRITARISNSVGKLMDGMNVRIIVENDVPDSFVVPKDAVVERDGYHVVFVYQNGEAVWTYVDVVHANIGYYAITGCQRKDTELHSGDVVITSGNLNLADGTKVKTKKVEK